MKELECTCGADEASWLFHDVDCPRRHLDGPWIPDPTEYDALGEGIIESWEDDGGC